MFYSNKRNSDSELRNLKVKTLNMKKKENFDVFKKRKFKENVYGKKKMNWKLLVRKKYSERTFKKTSFLQSE